MIGAAGNDPGQAGGTSVDDLDNILQLDNAGKKRYYIHGLDKTNAARKRMPRRSVL